jgi:hypothetical protein
MKGRTISHAIIPSECEGPRKNLRYPLLEEAVALTGQVLRFAQNNQFLTSIHPFQPNDK